MRKGQLISLESTTWPGTTRKLCLPILEQSGLHGGRDFWLAYSPEREDPGRKDHDTQSIPKLVGGIDETSTRLAVDLYSAAIAQVVPVESAESAKLLENIYRAVNPCFTGPKLNPFAINVSTTPAQRANASAISGRSEASSAASPW